MKRFVASLLTVAALAAAPISAMADSVTVKYGSTVCMRVNPPCTLSRVPTNVSFFLGFGQTVLDLARFNELLTLESQGSEIEIEAYTWIYNG
jgi:hypothetical protein